MAKKNFASVEFADLITIEHTRGKFTEFAVFVAANDDVAVDKLNVIIKMRWIQTKVKFSNDITLTKHPDATPEEFQRDIIEFLKPGFLLRRLAYTAPPKSYAAGPNMQNLKKVAAPLIFDDETSPITQDQIANLKKWLTGDTFKERRRYKDAPNMFRRYVMCETTNDAGDYAIEVKATFTSAEQDVINWFFEQGTRRHLIVAYRLKFINTNS